MESDRSGLIKSPYSTIKRQGQINNVRGQIRSLPHKLTPQPLTRLDEIKHQQKPVITEEFSTARINTRLFNARKQFSKPSVPTISFDDQNSLTTSPQSLRSTFSHTPMYKTDSFESGSSMPVSPSESLHSPNFEKNLTHVTTTMRALSTSPRIGSPNALIPPYNKSLQPLAYSYDSLNPDVYVDKCNVQCPTNKDINDKKNHNINNRIKPKGLLSPKSDNFRGPQMRGKSFISTTSPMTSTSIVTSGTSDDVLLGLVHQKSTESHDSSISMPSVTSSGGSPYTSGGSQLLLRQNQKGDKLYRSTEANFSTEDQGIKLPEQHIVRRSSYEMATGKMELPVKSRKKNFWKEALCSLKGKKDSLFKKQMKQSDECMEFGDPVYHLLRCAASPGHQPSTCKCICHLENGDECHKVITEMSTPMNVICAPAARRKSHYSTQSNNALNYNQHFTSTGVNDHNTQSKTKYTTFKKGRNNSNSQQFMHQT
ncbi:hypothetical protein EWB00_004290 [Schistosoma japonicum]|uniref:Uncharacterized protein n=1 Tax=Schistosoma japonicum TaxID=6182 RepID=A0A4Z2D5R9_SCHJA|nr:hypothetical protein EWB00_004290 [Schistosoma japonicum]